MSRPNSLPSLSLDSLSDVILLEMAAMHPRLSEEREAELKRRLFRLAVAADAGECEPEDLMRLFTAAMDEI